MSAFPEVQGVGNNAAVVFPQNQPVTGKANRQPSTPGPAYGTANRTPISNPVPVAVQSNYSSAPPTTQIVAESTHNPNPFNVATPIGIAAHTPLLTPIGIYPPQQPVTEQWTYDYGDGGGGGYGSQFRS